MTHQAIIRDAYARLKTTRKRTREGFLRAQAALTRTGIYEYTADELGLSGGNKIIKVMRTDESVFNSDTISSIRGAPLTINHPDEVTPQNWREYTIGNTVGEPRRSHDGSSLVSDVLIGDSQGIKFVEDGSDELSIGYTFKIEKADDMQSEFDYQTVGPVIVNHVALVDAGRAGSTVRIFDSTEVNDMDEKTLQNAVSAAVDNALAKTSKNDDTANVSKAISDALSPVLSKMDALQKQADEKDAAEKAKAAADKAKGAADELRKSIIADERKRAKVLLDVAPFLSDEAKKTVESADTKAILVAAVGDRVEDAANKSEDYLAGVISQMSADTNTGSTVNHDADDIFNMDVGVAPAAKKGADAEYDNYVKHLTEAYKQPQNVNGSA